MDDVAGVGRQLTLNRLAPLDVQEREVEGNQAVVVLRARSEIITQVLSAPYNCSLIDRATARMHISNGRLKPRYNASTDTIEFPVPAAGGMRITYGNPEREIQKLEETRVRGQQSLLYRVLHRVIAWITPTNALAQIINSVLDDFNRANENPLDGATDVEWTGPVRASETPQMQIVSDDVFRATGSGNGSSYWTVSTFANPEVFSTTADATGNTNENHIWWIVYAGVGTSGADGYALIVTQAATDTWSLRRMDDDTTLTTLGTNQNQNIAAGNIVRLAHSAAGPVAQLCTPTCANVHTHTDVTYTGSAHIGIGMNNANMTHDDFGGGAARRGIWVVQ
jgi:hypothetical protein